MEHYLNCGKIETAIKRAKKKLKNEASENGLYENFGQKEVREIEDTFIDNSDYTKEMNQKREKLEQFEEWCLTYEQVPQ